MRNGFTNRIARLETARGRSDGLFFIAWGRDRAGIERVLVAAQSTGTVQAGDIVVRAIWADPKTPRPRSRWVPDQTGAPSRIEFDALADMTELLELADAVASEISSRIQLPDYRSDPASLNDAQLIGIVHGRPLE